MTLNEIKKQYKQNKNMTKAVEYIAIAILKETTIIDKINDYYNIKGDCKFYTSKVYVYKIGKVTGLEIEQLKNIVLFILDLTLQNLWEVENAINDSNLKRGFYKENPDNWSKKEYIIL